MSNLLLVFRAWPVFVVWAFLRDNPCAATFFTALVTLALLERIRAGGDTEFNLIFGSAV
jgi:hypothetical protein